MDKNHLPYAANNLTGRPLEHYMEIFRSCDTGEIAERTGAPLSVGTFTLTMLGEERAVTWPDFANEGWKDKDRILALRFLVDGKKPAPAGGFVTYRELPWGEVYDRQFHARCIDRLTGTFGTRIADFSRACESLGGRPTGKNCAGYELEFMPGLFVRLLLWEGDEDFPASAQILFSDNFPQAFTAEDCVIVTEYILSRLTAVR